MSHIVHGQDRKRLQKGLRMSDAAKQGLSLRLAEHVSSCRFSDLPDTTVHAAKRALLDGYGVMLAASGLSADARPFIDMALAAGSGPVPLIGRDERVGTGMAAFANGALSHALDYEDAFDAAPSHPNAALLPAVLALIHEGRPVTGERLLTAVAVGCDIACRLGLSLTRRAEDLGWYPPPMLGAYAATAAAANLLGLSAEQTRDAFSLTLCQATMPGEIKYSRDTVIRAVREAFPAQAAVQSAKLAQAGVRGFEEPFEGTAGFFRLFVDGGYDPAVLFDRLGSHFWIEDLSFKQWPACRGTHPFIEIAQQLRAEGGFAAQDVEAIVARGSAVQTMLSEPIARKRAPATAIDAKFSIPFTIAAALTESQVTLESFTEDALADAGRRALAARVSYEVIPGWGVDKASAGTLRVALRDGRVLEGALDESLGHPSRPLGDAALLAKFRDCAGQAFVPLDSEQSEALAERIFSLETEPDAAAALFGRAS
jgi:2-methylcitrate dehydratase PrpD